MADVKWIKICTDIFDDEKMCLIEGMPEADGIIVCWFKLLCMAGKQNNSGVLMLNDKIAYTDEMLATVFRRPLNTVRLALEVFEKFGMVEIIEGAITIPNWGKHQNLDQLENKKAYMRDYMKGYREKQKALTSGKSLCKTNVSSADKDIDKDIEEDKEKKKSVRKTASRFTPPTLEEVKAYCIERGNNVDAERFIDYYTANGWKVGKNSMKDWKAAVRTWERSDRGNTPKKQGGGILDDFNQMNEAIEGGLFD